MPKVLFVHSAGPQGAGEGSSALLAGLKASLSPETELVAPQMPDPDNPMAEPWIAACRSATSGVEDNLILVGHSLGGSIILQTLAQFGLPTRLLGVVTLASPFWNAPDWEVESFALTEQDAGKLIGLPRLILVQGDADQMVAADHPDRYKALLPIAEIRRLAGVDHEAASAGPALAGIIAEIAP